MSALQGKVALVTGAAQGLGATFARALAAVGAKVALCDVRDPQAVVDEIRSTGGTALGGIVDITSPAAVAGFVDGLVRTLGGLHVLVNNAAFEGSPKPKPILEITSEDWDRTMAVNARGAFECVKAVLPVMRRQGYGKIVNLTSSLAFRGAVGMLPYVTSKGAVLGMTRALARELGPDNITVNAIAPGRTMSEAAIAKGRDGGAAMARRAMARDEHPTDLIGTLIFLASPASDFITGQTIVVDGGDVMH